MILLILLCCKNTGPFDLHALDNVNSDFTAFVFSAMSQAVNSDILKGRPSAKWTQFALQSFQLGVAYEVLRRS